ncbi:aspartate/glutamate racemase family protein [Solicola gregarius]|uniref:Aspartate/glutamate racemase family protein n=1 Tax=Solicola gregarius TaxID=2908642 RepID=A0AA46TL66_9ACTN|nr:aspartate/glutamate racemase family protein [Solicola gregarius]UYM07158.1 aspartate/glutamate racemase family protein [Solicola gregarius]
MRHLGILAHSVPGAALCFREFGEEGMRRLGSHDHPDVSLDCIAMGRSMGAWDSGDYEVIRSILATSVERLARTGADSFVCPDNTAHLALERPGPDLALPGLHIAEVVARHAAGAGHRTVGILGTKWTMEADLYPRVLAAHGLESRIPEPADRAVIQDLTFGELVHGVFSDGTRARFVETIEGLRAAGCDAVALVCTEFPLLVTPDASPLPTLDSTILLARAATSVGIGSEPMPVWRGGRPG